MEDERNMNDGIRVAGGLTRRRPRLTDQETERRMLETAAAMVNRAGLTVSLDHISFEDLIRDARVSRSAAYRRWPYKDLFFSDLLRELARAATPAAIAGERASLPGIRQFVRDHAAWLRTPEGRHDLLLGLFREGALHDFDTLHASTEWRTYLALHATFLSVTGEELRADLQRGLGVSDRAFVARIATSWERLSGLLGYRIRPGTGVTFETIARLASADLRGHVIMALANEEMATQRIRARLFGASEVADWSLPAIAIASIATALFEPDPAISWDDARIAAVSEVLERWA